MTINYAHRGARDFNSLLTAIDLIIKSIDETKYDKAGGNIEGNVTVDGDITSSGFISGKQVGVFASLSEPASTTITTANTYYPVNGTFNNDPVGAFGAATVYTPGIKYTGSRTQYFKVFGAVVVKVNRSNTTVTMGVKKNNVLATGITIPVYCLNANQPYPAPGLAVFELAENDEVQLVVTSDGNGDIVTFNTINVAINEFFD